MLRFLSMTYQKCCCLFVGENIPLTTMSLFPLNLSPPCVIVHILLLDNNDKDDNVEEDDDEANLKTIEGMSEMICM